MKKYCCILLALSITAHAASFPTGWGRVCPLIQRHTQVGGTVACPTNFPALVAYRVTADGATCLPSELLATGGANAGNSDGGDIRFTADREGTVPLHSEIVSFAQSTTSNGSAEIWVNLTSVSSSADTTFYLWYHNPSASMAGSTDATWGSQGVWTNYASVWHLGQASGTTVLDSSPNLVNSSANTGTTVSAQIGQGSNFSSQYISASNNAMQFGTGNFTVSFWVYPTSFAAETALYDTLILNGVGSRQHAFVLVANSSTAKLRIFTNSAYTGNTVAGLNLTAWNFVTVSRTGTTLTYYINSGKADANTSALSTSITSGGEVVGRYADAAGGYLAGKIDEIQSSTVARSADWIFTAYNNQSSPSTFWSVGTPASNGSGGNAVIFGGD